MILLQLHLILINDPQFDDDLGGCLTERPNRYKLETLGSKFAQLIKQGPKWDESNTLGTKFAIKLYAGIQNYF